MQSSIYTQHLALYQTKMSLVNTYMSLCVAMVNELDLQIITIVVNLFFLYTALLLIIDYFR